MAGAEFLLPMCALALWTIVVLGLVPVARIRAARAGRVHVKDFRYGESPNVPGDVSLPNRDYMNLLELPVLFYAVVLGYYVTELADAIALGLAWGFVGLRVVHSLIHLTYNNVLHRLVAFAAGVTVLATLWIKLAVNLL